MDITPKKRNKPRSITLAFYNANGLGEDRDELELFINRHKIDVLLVQETFLKPAHKPPRIANYNMIRDDRLGRHGGGTLIYYKRSLHCSPVEPVPVLQNLEVSVCRLAMTGHSPITIVSAYQPPNKRLRRSDLASLFALDDAVIIAGDLNSKHERFGCVATTPNGVRLCDLSERLDFEVLVPLTPTRYPHQLNQRADVLDMALLKNVALSMHSIEVIHDLNSDHRPVLLQLGPPLDTAPATRTMTDWKKLKQTLAATDSPLLNSIPDQILSPADTDHAIDALSSHLANAISGASRQVPVATDRHLTDLPDDIRELIRAKRAASRIYATYRTEENRTRLRSLQYA